MGILLWTEWVDSKDGHFFSTVFEGEIAQLKTSNIV